MPLWTRLDNTVSSALNTDSNAADFVKWYYAAWNWGELGKPWNSSNLGSTFGERLDAAVSGTDATGLVTAQWISEVGDIYRAFTPTMNNWSRVAMPDKGMTFNLPLVTVKPTAAIQSTQNTEVESTALTVSQVAYTINTYGAGQNTSIQTIQRSEPAYLQVLFAQYVQIMAKTINLAAATQLLADADDVNTTGLEYTTANALPDLIVDAALGTAVTAGIPNALARIAAWLID